MKQAVLLISPPNDPNLIAIRSVLQHKKIPNYHIDITESRKSNDLQFLISTDYASAQITDRFGAKFKPQDIRGVWCRTSAFHRHAPPSAGSAKNFVRHEEIYALEYFFYLLQEATWVNPIFPPSLTRRAIANRLIQSRLAVSVGLSIPTHLVSNSKQDLCDFVEDSNPNGAINKQIGQGSSSEAGPVVVFTTKIDAKVLSEIDGHCGCPVLLQKYIDKAYEIRAYVIGDSVFAAAIDTVSNGHSLIDSRESTKTGLTHYRIQLDDDEERKLVRLNALLGLRYSAVDLIRHTDGTLVFLEANPSGQWGFVESLTGYPITERIVEELML